METGNIKIKENDKQQFVVNVKLVNGNLWLSTCQMADLFNTAFYAITQLIESPDDNRYSGLFTLRTHSVIHRTTVPSVPA